MIRNSKKRQHFLIGLLIALSIGLVICLIAILHLFSTFSRQSGDLLFRDDGPPTAPGTDSDIVIVAIDDASLGELGRFSGWPRSYHTRVVDTLSESGARIIVFDILFSEPSPDDAELETAIGRAGNVIIPFAASSGAPYGGLALIEPLGAFKESAAAAGHAIMIPDDDGVVRALPVLMQNGERLEPALSLTAVAEFLRRPQAFDAVEGRRIKLAGRAIPLDTPYNMLINYRSNASAQVYGAVSYADVLRGDVSPDIFKDKIVLIGITALGFGDVYWTPMGGALSGVEIHAQAINTILSGDFLQTAPDLFLFLSILLLAVICGWAVLRFRVAWATLSGALLAAVYYLAAFYYFEQGLVLNMFYPPFALAAVFLGVNLFNVTEERIEKREIARTFGRYVSPSVATQILNTIDEGSLKLGGDENRVTVMFADVRNFTGLCEKFPPQEVVRTLNIYLSAAIDVILHRGGMINKFGGDSVMAVWNAPVACEEHALKAAEAAIEAQREMKALQADASLQVKMEFGIGINTGDAVVGNMGSLDRLEYSVIGDTVNTAARLSSAAPGGRIWIGAETYELVKDKIDAIPLEPLALKGKGELIHAYEISLSVRSPFDGALDAADRAIV